MKRALFLVSFALTMAVTCALNCYNCNDCANFDDSSTVSCGADATHCLKLHSVSGQIVRLCGTEEACIENERKVEIYSSVDCCKSDYCNRGAITGPADDVIIIATTFFFCFFIKNLY